MYYSVKLHHEDFDFYVLPFDSQTYDYLSKLNEPHIKLIPVEEYDAYFQTSRSKFTDNKQYYFTATPNICIYLFEKFPEIDILLYLDADVYVFNSLDPVYEEFGDSCIGFCTHRLHPLINLYAKSYGKYNVGVNLFRNSETGQRCLKEWKDNCDNWFSGQPGYKLNFFSDQIFLDDWLEKYDGAKIIGNIGVNVCHWNAVNYRFRKKGDSFYVNDKPLIIYHFSSLRKEDDYRWNANSIYAFVSIRKVLLEIYRKYIGHIESFGISNRKWEKINHKETFRKRIFHSVMKLFLNEIIIWKS